MNTKEFEEIIIQVIKKILNKSNGKFDVNKNMPLIGSGSLLDSMKLVELCIELEDIAEKKDLILIGHQKKQCLSL